MGMMTTGTGIALMGAGGAAMLASFAPASLSAGVPFVGGHSAGLFFGGMALAGAGAAVALAETDTKAPPQGKGGAAKR